MFVEILAVHPGVTIVQAGGDRLTGGAPSVAEQKEVPTGWFPTPPKAGQRWDMNFEPVKTSAEQYALLNEYLSHG